MSEPRLIDRRWPWMALAVAIYVAVMGYLHFMLKGFNDDFGTGFGLGLVSGAFIAVIAAGLRRGEHRPSEPAQEPPRYVGPIER